MAEVVIRKNTTVYSLDDIRNLLLWMIPQTSASSSNYAIEVDIGYFTKKRPDDYFRMTVHMQGPKYIRSPKSRMDRSLGLLHPKLYAPSALEQLADVLVPEGRVAPVKLLRELWLWLLGYLRISGRTTKEFPVGLEDFTIRILDTVEQPIKRRSKEEVKRAKVAELEQNREAAYVRAYNKTRDAAWAVQDATKVIMNLDAELLALGVKPKPIEGVELGSTVWRAQIADERGQLDTFITMLEAAEAP